MKSTKVMSIVLALTLVMAIFSSCAVFASAEVPALDTTKANVQIAAVEAAPGATIKVPVTVNNMSVIWGATLNFKFDSKLALKSYEAGDVFTSSEILCSEIKGGETTFTYTAQAAELKNKDVKSGTLVVLVFEVSSSAAVGDTAVVEFESATSADFIDVDANDIAMTYGAGSVKVAAAPVATTKAPAAATTKAPAAVTTAAGGAAAATTAAAADGAAATTNAAADANPNTGAAAAPIAAVVMAAAAAFVIAKSKK